MKKFIKKWTESSLILKIIIGMIIGVILGLMGSSVALIIEHKAGYYKCTECGYTYVPKFKNFIFTDFTDFRIFLYSSVQNESMKSPSS